MLWEPGWLTWLHTTALWFGDHVRPRVIGKEDKLKKWGREEDGGCSRGRFQSSAV